MLTNKRLGTVSTVCRFALAIGAIVFSPIVVGHGFGQRYDLPVPLWLWVTGAGATIASATGNGPGSGGDFPDCDRAGRICGRSGSFSQPCAGNGLGSLVGGSGICLCVDW